MENRRKVSIRYVGPKGILPLKMEAYFQCWYNKVIPIEDAVAIKKQWVEGNIAIVVSKDDSKEIETRFSLKGEM